jgi:hypothetical protein
LVDGDALVDRGALGGIEVVDGLEKKFIEWNYDVYTALYGLLGGMSIRLIEVFAGYHCIVGGSRRYFK